ncbi:MAG: SPFH domain-containing protein [Bacteroidetes bacterium]|uniref:SPFH domain-containing protein n=1 Tax=Candidatus Cryptobacteroides intestinigallinarum TaxID=2840767 RepID=A0A9D9HLM6_9BACT|nr:SPFH domain-containing protein [Candidatus Cryptobacteroides intestinigallinarum]
MGIFSKNKLQKGAIADVIRCPHKDYLIWKWAPDGDDQDGLRADAIRYGSYLTVAPGETAALFYNQSNGDMVEYIKGPVQNLKIETANLPILSSIIGAGYGGGTPFSASVYFINTAGANQFSFFIDDCMLTDYETGSFIPAKIKGKVSFGIADCERFIGLHNLRDMDTFYLKEKVKETIIDDLKPIFGNASEQFRIPAVLLPSNTDKIRNMASAQLEESLDNDFAVKLLRLNIESLQLDTTHENYVYLRAQLDNKAKEAIYTSQIRTAQARNKLQAVDEESKRMSRENDIVLDNMEDTLRRQREEAQRLSKLRTETEHLAAHQINVQGDVAYRAAESLGELGSSGGATMGGDGGMNVAGMMAGMMMGGAVGSNMANMMGTMGQNIASPAPPTPPPASVAQYHVIVNGQQSGPYNMTQVSNMIASGQLTRDSYVWKQGMPAWAQASALPELAAAFGAVPPPFTPPQGPPPPPVM